MTSPTLSARTPIQPDVREEFWSKFRKKIASSSRELPPVRWFRLSPIEWNL